MKKTCPKCGADGNGTPTPKKIRYWCSSFAWGNGYFYQSPECVKRERDNLLERVKRLEEVLNRILDNNGSRNTFRAIGLYDAQVDAENLLKEIKP